MLFLRVLVLFVVFTAYSTADPSCKPPGGQIDTFQKGMCNCWSGYAPSTIEGTDCNSHPKCAPASPDAWNAVQGNAPKAPKTSFNNDRLEVFQQIPIVQNRKAAWIQFVIPTGFPSAGTSGLKTCQYPGPLWNKTVNSLDCIDEYRASVPWSQHEPCGFAKDMKKTTNSTIVISSTLVTTVVETYKTGLNTYERLSSTSYLISVSFASQKTFQSGVFSAGIVDPTASGVLNKYIISDSIYDPITGATTVDFITTVLWPYQLAQDSASLDAAFVGVVPAIPSIHVTLSALTDSSLICGFVARSTCEQKWRATISSIGSCINNIQGAYNFKEPLVCRDNATNKIAGGCPKGVSSVPLTINVHKTQLCDVTPVDTSTANSFTLTPYSDADHTFTSVQFQSGDTVYWTFQVANPLVSIKSISFNSIQLVLTQQGSTPDILYDSSNGGISSKGSAVNLKTTGLNNAVSPGASGTLSFSYVLSRSKLPNTVGGLQPNNLEVQIATSVVVDIQYYGNSKRSVAMDLSSMDAMSAGSDSKAIRVVAADLMTENDELEHPLVDSSALLAIPCLTLTIILSLILQL